MSKSRFQHLRYRIGLSGRAPISGSHVRRLGARRVWLGGGSMYFSTPMFVAVHAATRLAFDGVVGPLMGVQGKPPRRYLVVLDRFRIRELPFLDRLGCAFCGYANGVCMMASDRLDRLAERAGEVSAPRRLPTLPRDSLASGARKLLAGVTGAVASAALLPFQLHALELVYGRVVAPTLGLHHLSAAAAETQLETLGYAAGAGPLARRLLRHHKRFLVRVATALEQIESAWCPLRHLKQPPEIEVPPHHARFFAHDQLDEMRRTLRAEGTVSELKPTVAANPPATRRGVRAILTRVQGGGNGARKTQQRGNLADATSPRPPVA
jgi:hypothetical protein